MKLIEYLVRDQQGLVDAIFEADDGKFWHVQRIGSRKNTSSVARPQAVFTELPELPVLEGQRSDYPELPAGGGFELRDMKNWYELILLFLQSEGGAAAMALYDLA